MVIQSYKRLRIEDFPEEQQELIEKLSTSLNTTIENIIEVLNAKVSFVDNIFSSLRTFNVEVDINNTPKNNIQVKINTTTPIEGILVINALSVNNSNVYPNSAVQVFFTQKADLLTIKKVVGLPANSEFTLKIITIN